MQCKMHWMLLQGINLAIKRIIILTIILTFIVDVISILKRIEDKNIEDKLIYFAWLCIMNSNSLPQVSIIN